MQDSETSALNRTAWHATWEFAIRPLIFMTEKPDGPAEEVWSGTLIRSGAASQLLVLSARHNFEEDGKVASPGAEYWLGASGEDAVVVTLTDLQLCPSDGTRHPDVALASFDHPAPDTLLDRALEPEAIATADDGDVVTGKCVLLGYPAHLVETTKREQRFQAQLYAPRVLPDRDPNGRLCLSWEDEVEDHSERVHLSDRPPLTTKKPLQAPHGISGGAVWYFPSAPENVPWSPSRGKVVAIPVAYKRDLRVEFAEHVDAWSTWFHDAVAKA